MTTFVQFTPALNSEVNSQLSGSDSVLTNNAVVAPTNGASGLIGANSNVGVNLAIGYNNFTFQATFDDIGYNVIVTWSIYGQRYYVNIYDTNNVLVVSLPLIGSPNDYDISMTAGYFTSTLVYRTATQQFEITP